MKSTPLTKLILPIYLPSIIFSTGTGAINPVLVIAALRVGFDDAGSSAAVGLFGLVGIVMSPLIGRVISKIGDRTALIFGGVSALIALALFLWTLAQESSSGSRGAFLTAIVILALAGNTWSLARQAYIAETTPVAWRARGLSTLGGMIRIGMLIGPLISTALLTMFFLESVFILNVILVVMSLILVIVFVVPYPEIDINQIPEADRSRHEYDVNRMTSKLSTVIMGIALNALGILRASRNVVVPLWGTFLGFDPAFITATFAVTALLDTTMFIVAGTLMDKKGRHWALIPALVVMPLGIVVMILWTTPVGFIVGGAILGLGNGFGAGIVMTIGADLSPAKNKASFLGIWQAINAIGMAAGPFIISGMTSLISLEAGLWTIAGTGVVGVVWTLVFIRTAYSRLGMDLQGRPLSG